VHASSYTLMSDFVARFVTESCSVADVGSRNVSTLDTFDFLHRCGNCGFEFRHYLQKDSENKLRTCPECHKRRCERVDDGTYRPLFEHCAYEGLDAEAGPNVDRVVDLYDFGTKQYDVGISGQCLEHVEDTHRWVEAFQRIVKPGGLMCVIVPASQIEHRFPIDCWRILPDAMRWLFRAVKVVECRLVVGEMPERSSLENVLPHVNRFKGEPEKIDDTILIARK